MFFLAHVDKIVDDHAAQVAEPDLPGDFLGGHDIYLVRGVLGRAFGAETAAVHVDGHQGLGLVDDDRAARPQGHGAAVDFGDFFVQVVFVKERFLALEQLQAVDVAGHHKLQKFLGPLVGLWLVDVNRVHLGGEDIANGADDHVVFFVDIDRAGQFADPAAR